MAGRTSLFCYFVPCILNFDTSCKKIINYLPEQGAADVSPKECITNGETSMFKVLIKER